MHDIALSGAAVFDRPLPGATRGSEISLALAQLGSVGGKVMAVTSSSTHVSLDLDEDAERQLESFLSSPGHAA